MNILSSFQDYIEIYMDLDTFLEPCMVPEKGDVIRLELEQTLTQETDFDYFSNAQNYDISLRVHVKMFLRGAARFPKKVARKSVLLDQFMNSRQHPALEFEADNLSDSFSTNIVGHMHSPIKRNSTYSKDADNMFTYTENWLITLKTTAAKILV